MLQTRNIAAAFRRAYASCGAPTPREELARVAELQGALQGVSAQDSKKRTIAQYGDLRRLLEL